MELIHLVGVATRAITPCAARSSIASISLGLRATVMQRGVCCQVGWFCCHESTSHPDSLL